MFLLNRAFQKQNEDSIDQKKLELQDLGENGDNTSKRTYFILNKLNNLQEKKTWCGI